MYDVADMGLDRMNAETARLNAVVCEMSRLVLLFPCKTHSFI